MPHAQAVADGFVITVCRRLKDTSTRLSQVYIASGAIADYLRRVPGGQVQVWQEGGRCIAKVGHTPHRLPDLEGPLPITITLARIYDAADHTLWEA